MSYALFKNKQIGLKLEGTPGTMEARLGSDCYGLQVTEITAAAEPEVIEQETFKGSISASPARIGKVPANVSLAGELKNSGKLGDMPKIGAILHAAKFARYDVFCENESADDSWVKGKTMIGGKGLFVGSDAGKFYYAAISENSARAGTFAGHLYKPSSGENSDGTYTLSISDGGLKKEIYGAACTFTMETSTTNYPSWTAAFTGIADSKTWGSQAEPALEGIVWENHLPAIVVNGNIKIGKEYSPITQSIQIDLGNEVVLIEDQNSDTWFKHALVVKRAATATVNLSVADLEKSGELYRKLFAGEVAEMSFRIGEGEGNQIDVILPAVQYTGISESDNNSLLAQALTLKLTGEDDEILLWFR
jgi:hypothetical protein